MYGHPIEMARTLNLESKAEAEIRAPPIHLLDLVGPLDLRPSISLPGKEVPRLTCGYSCV